MAVPEATQLLSATHTALEVLVKQWETRNPTLWQQREDLYLGCGKQAIALGQPTLAFDILREGRSYFPESTALAYTAALALARSGSIGHAADIVQQLLSTLSPEDALYPDILSLAGRVAKEQWAKSPDGPQKQAFGRRAARRYRAAYQAAHGDWYPGINAATMSVLTGDLAGGLAIARAVRDQCQAQRASAKKADYWLLATLGEAHLLLGAQNEAIACYQQAIHLAGANAGDAATIRRQVQLLAAHIPVDQALLEVLRAPCVAMFSGHMLDAPGRAAPRFPAALEGAVRQALLAELQRLDVGYGYAAAACGADILFHECLLHYGAESHVILPFRQDDFIQASVAFAGEEWVQRFHQVLSRATTVHYAIEEGYLGDDVLFDYNNALLKGRTLLHAAHLGAEPLGLFVLDTLSPTLVGGTQDALQTWRQTGHRYAVISLASLRAQQPTTLSHPVVRPASAPETEPVVPALATLPPRQLQTMLFADMVGFSTLAEESAPLFMVHFWGEVAKVIHTSAVKPVFKNTWGDGLFLVFETITGGADFALRLRDAMQQTDWRAAGLPADMHIRIGLHAGPVFPGFDPIIEHLNFFGSHVNIAARIEPITFPGAVYVSEQFASLLVASDVEDFSCDYMGHLALAKGFRGRFPIYRLRRASELE
ncbi:MAG: TRAFs-binding domain-containing protein [Candidatus Tectimicrobiota bacterium]